MGRAGESAGPYRLHIDLVTDQSNSRGGAEPVALGSSAMGFISGEGDEDYFLFTAPGADHFRVYTVGPTDTVGKLEDSRGSILGANDDGQLSLGHDAFLIERYLPAGTYFVSVTGWEGETGPYRLVVETATDPGDSTGGAQDLELGVPVISHIGAGDVDFFKLTLDEKTEVAFFAAGDTDTRATLLQGDGDTVVGHDDDSGEGLNFLIHTTLAGGTHYLRVEGYDNDVTGSYVLLVKPLVPLRTIGPSPGSTRSGASAPVTTKTCTSSRLPGRSLSGYTRRDSSTPSGRCTTGTLRRSPRTTIWASRALPDSSASGKTWQRGPTTSE